MAAVLAGCSTTPTGTPTPTPTVSVDREAAGVKCADGGACAIGDIGPGGGMVFYDAGSVQPWGRYLEVGPDFTRTEWCDVWDLFVAGTKETIGTGKTNTELITAACGAGAANTVSDYDGGGKTDWFLPSRDELNELYKQRDSVGGFETDKYWSSSQYVAYAAWGQYLIGRDGYQSGSATHYANGVRPVRAF
jgi:hypothetical protein